MNPLDAHLDDDDALPPAERAALDALPREREPGRLLEERTVRALRERGLLRAPGRRIRFPAAWIGGAVAAGIALFLGGVTVGQWMGQRGADRVVAEIQRQNAQQAALLVQQTGSAYVNAMAAYASLSDSARGSQGREVARQMLRAAAEEVVRISPDDPVAAGILASFDRVQQQQTRRPGEAEGKKRTVWF
ncbi:MAG TPA: hypothetical protein VFQ39_17885 [Longimicrobium sp.]|nr:hypothetical protein [Longimicrobium sp.]